MLFLLNVLPRVVTRCSGLMAPWLVALLLITGKIHGDQVLIQNFASSPQVQGWDRYGDTNLFHWDAQNQWLEVTWDSARTNSYFHFPLGQVLNKEDDFALSFDLWLEDIVVGSDPERPYTFNISAGFLNWTNAISPHFFRGTGLNSPNLVEWSYFPDSGNGATISPVVVSTNSNFVPGFNFPLELDPGHWFHMDMVYTATNRTLATRMTRDGANFGPIKNVVLPGSFSDFRVDTVALSSYSHDGVALNNYAGSVLAHGRVDNLQVTWPDPVLTGIGGAWSNQVWQVRFAARSSWLYQLEASTNLVGWTVVADLPAGTSGAALLQHTAAPPAPATFYRVRARR